MAAALAVSELLREARDLRVVVTSRSPLRLSGEQQCPVPPLVLPDLTGGVSIASVSGAESVRLFQERAAAAVPGFQLDESNAEVMASIAIKLDGLPLAIELAAARTKMLPPAEILARLEDALGFLVGGSRDLPDRQQTLRATIVWSHELLSADAKRLLAACAVFRGGAELTMVEAVCAPANDLGLPVLDVLQEVVD